MGGRAWPQHRGIHQQWGAPEFHDFGIVPTAATKVATRRSGILDSKCRASGLWVGLHVPPVSSAALVEVLEDTYPTPSGGFVGHAAFHPCLHLSLAAWPE